MIIRRSMWISESELSFYEKKEIQTVMDNLKIVAGFVPGEATHKYHDKHNRRLVFEQEIHPYDAVLHDTRCVS